MIEITDEEVRRLGVLLTEEHEEFLHAPRGPEFARDAVLRMWLIAAINESLCRVSGNVALLTATALDILLSELDGDAEALAKKFSAHLRGCVALWEQEVRKAKGLVRH